MKLKELPNNQPARIREVASGLIGNRLMEMGFYPDREIYIMVRAPFGDPIAVRIGNSTVMLRTAEAESIIVDLLEDD